MYMTMYPEFPGGWKCNLEAAIKHHNRSHCSSLGCSPQFALNGTVPSLQVDKILGVHQTVKLIEKRDSNKEQRCKARQKEQFDRRHSQKFPKVKEGDSILVRVGLPPHNKTYRGPFAVKAVDYFNGVPKRFFYDDLKGKEQVATLRNIVPYTPRRE